MDPSKSKKEQKLKMDECSKIFVGGVPQYTTEAMIRTCFRKFGRVKIVTQIKDQITGRQKAFCFVRFHSPIAARRALEAPFHFLNGKVVFVNMCRSGKGSASLNQLSIRKQNNGIPPGDLSNISEDLLKRLPHLRQGHAGPGLLGEFTMANYIANIFREKQRERQRIANMFTGPPIVANNQFQPRPYPNVGFFRGNFYQHQRGPLFPQVPFYQHRHVTVSRFPPLISTVPGGAYLCGPQIIHEVNPSFDAPETPLYTKSSAIMKKGDQK